MKEDPNNSHRYDDIINLEHHVSSYRKPMSIRDRSAQFSPFAAVSGYDTAIKETARLTVKKSELDENAKTLLNEKLTIIQEQLNNHPKIELIFFQADDMKSGGSYLTITGIVKKIDIYERDLVMQNGTRVPIEDIVDITGDIFQSLEDFFA